MAILHTVNKSPFERNALESCLRLAQPGAAVLLMEDGVYGALDGTRASAAVADATASLKVFVLGPDLAARGLGDSKLIEGIETVDYEGFVDLAVEYNPVQAWL